MGVCWDAKNLGVLGSHRIWSLNLKTLLPSLHGYHAEQNSMNICTEICRKNWGPRIASFSHSRSPKVTWSDPVPMTSY